MSQIVSIKGDVITIYSPNLRRHYDIEFHLVVENIMTEVFTVLYRAYMVCIRQDVNVKQC